MYTKDKCVNKCKLKGSEVEYFTFIIYLCPVFIN